MSTDELAGYLPVVAIILLTVLVLLGLLLLIRRLQQLHYLLTRKQCVLEITPPARGDKTPEATTQLMRGLSSLLSTRTFLERLLGRHGLVSLEIVASRNEGIRYLIFCSDKHAKTIEHLVAAYVTDARVKYIAGYERPRERFSKVYEYNQRRHFAYPLKSFDYLTDHDPISYVTNAMTKLGDDELMALQLVIQPVKSREIHVLARQLLINADVKPRLAKRSVGRGVVQLLGQVLSRLLFAASDTLTSIISPSYSSASYTAAYARSRETDHQRQVAQGVKPARQLSYFEQQLMASLHAKLQEPMFATDIRVLVSVKRKADLVARRQHIEAALGLYSVPDYQQLVRRTAKYYLLQRYVQWSYYHRLPSLLTRHRSLLGTSELASLYHFPDSKAAKTENVVKSLSKTLPAPVSLKAGRPISVLLGQNRHHGITTPIGLTEAERERHMYIMGGTGNGKTTMLKYQIVQDMLSGKGVAVVDPHGDLAEELLGYVPEDRQKDVIYINPDDLAFPIGINLLELPEGLEGDELAREKDLITESTVSVLRKIFSQDDSGGHRVEYVLRNAIQTALTLPEANLFAIFRLLNDKQYRNSVVKSLKDRNLRIFWENELGKAGEMQRVKMAAGITSKIGRFLFSASARRMLEQNRSTIDFDAVMDERKIIICNFSKGLLGEDTSMLFGVTLLAKLQLAGLRRARVMQADRVPFYVYVDEFQNFATMSFVQMLSEARKYKLFLTMAEQSTQQQEDRRLVHIILANVGTVVAFRSGSPEDERLILPLFKPYVQEGEISNLPAYNYYCRIMAVDAQEPMSGETVLLDRQPDLTIARATKKLSRRAYGRKYVPPKEESAELQPEKKQERVLTKVVNRKKK